MNEYYEQKMTVLPSVSDAEGYLGIADSFALFMDVASIHAELLGVGMRAMQRRGRFWLTVKTKVRFLRRPRMGEQAIATTWPEPPEHMRCCRSYALSDLSGAPLIVGKTEWAVLDLRTKALAPMEGVYPDGLSFSRQSACPEPFARIAEQAGDWKPWAEYTVRSTDIDVGSHMNNVAYIRAVLGSFSTAELQEMQPREMDVIFRASAYEGQRLLLERRENDRDLELRVRDEQEKTLLLVRMQRAAGKAAEEK